MAGAVARGDRLRGRCPRRAPPGHIAVRVAS
jgi:hypothetical protein